MRSRAKFSFFLVLLLSSVARAAVDVAVGPATIEAAPAGDSAIRLTISYDHRATPLPSTFLSPDLPAGSSTTVQENNWTGIKTSAGELLIDPSTGHWTLRDATGKTLIPPCDLGSLATNLQTGKQFVLFNVGCDSARKFQVYGCGDGADELLQQSADPSVGNGHAVVPYYWSKAGYAVLAVSGDDNTPASWTASSDLGRVQWIFPGDSADLYLMPAANLAKAAEAFAALSGPPAVPPRWTFGYLQSRWGWKDKAYIDDAVNQFITRKLPVDAFIFDFEWYTVTPDYAVKAEGLPTFTDFSFNPALFPQPAEQISAMNDQGIHFVGIRKPRLGNSDLLAMARSKGWILPPGSSHSEIDARCLDFRNPQVRAWYADQTVDLLKAGVSGWWDDEGELTYTTYYWWNQAEAEALAKINPAARLWTIDRAFSPGNQRFGAAAWTGDIRASWAELAKTPAHLLNWTLAGMPYVTCDIGGFAGDTTPQLLTRWMEAGVFFPVMRSHSTVDAIPHFPWLYGPDAESAIRKALDLRYRLVPFYYSEAHYAHVTGLPIMRPLAMGSPSDPRCADLTDEWLVGDKLLAAPILDDTDTRRVYLPAGIWYALNDTTPVRGGRDFKVTAKLDEIPAYVRAGTILPLGPVIQHTADLPGGPLEVQVYPGHSAHFTLTEDDGLTTDYLHGDLRHTIFTWDDASRTLSWKIDGSYAGRDIFTDLTVSVMDSGGVKHGAGSITSDGSVVVPQ
ncbi:MAG TPA: TIM-barrel domain-containing protein [Tepidisphaeraceae bacterium]|nr:TIM-barrel domain-containing protein [Tepidisphaeraceae bacterium]